MIQPVFLTLDFVEGAELDCRLPDCTRYVEPLLPGGKKFSRA